MILCDRNLYFLYTTISPFIVVTPTDNWGKSCYILEILWFYFEKGVVGGLSCDIWEACH